MKSLLMFSGGLDSTAALKWLLEKTTDEIHLHYVEYRNNRQRWAAERIAVKQVLEAFKANPFYAERMTYSESVQDYTGLGTFIDAPMIAYTAAIVCMIYPSIDRVVIGYTASDDMMKPHGTNWQEAIKDRHVSQGRQVPVNIGVVYKTFHSILDCDTKKREFLFPLKDMTKKELIQFVGEGLYNLTWSCRMPVWHLSRPKACGSCMTCRKLLEAEAELGVSKNPKF